VEYVWLATLVLAVVPSPKVQSQVVTCPVVVLAKVTPRGATPEAGDAAKFTTGLAYGTCTASSLDRGLSTFAASYAATEQ
jgi:hypothetical protein